MNASGPGGGKFKSSHPDHLKQWVTVPAVAHFLFGMASGVANEGEIGLFKTGTLCLLKAPFYLSLIFLNLLR